jgi:hypothetical protein
LRLKMRIASQPLGQKEFHSHVNDSAHANYSR